MKKIRWSLSTRSRAWLAGRPKWLFILDNADELAIVEEFIPPAFQGHLLLTTRAQVMGGLAKKFEVKVMTPEKGALLLLRRAGLIAPDATLEQASPADVAVAQDLSEEMGGLPLALDQAGAYIEDVPCSLQDYQQLYQSRRAELLKKRGGVEPDHPEFGGDHLVVGLPEGGAGQPGSERSACDCVPSCIPTRSPKR